MTISTGHLTGLVCLLVISLPGNAHLLNMTEAQIQLQGATGSATVQLRIDLLRTAGSAEQYLALAEDLRNPIHQPLWDKLAAGIELRQGSRRLEATFVAALPPDPLVPEDFADAFRWPRLSVDLSARGYDPQLPLQVTFTSAFVFEEPIAITISDEQSRLSRWLITDQPSPLFVSAEVADGLVAGVPFWVTLSNAFQAGFLHIFPSGIDHLLFVLAVMLACTNVRQTVILVSAFTVGHSISLAVAGFRLINVPGHIVEPLILLSISLYGLLAALGHRAERTHQYWAVGAVGLLHGLGFATAFAALDWSASPWLVLAGFNLGIEAAQLLFVLVAFALLVRCQPSQLKPVGWLLVVAPLILLFQ
ncbi:MAG: HupE/UreJ family protein [Pseudomonadota bacterium]